MKKMIVLAALLLCGAASLNLWAQDLPRQELPRLAVVEFSSNNTAEKTKQDLVTVRSLVEGQLAASGRFQIVSRNEIDKLIKEQGIALSAISSTENVRKLQLMSIRYIVTGSVNAMGLDYAVTINVLDVSSGKFAHSESDFVSGVSREMYTGINALMAKFISGMSAGEDGAIVQGAAIPGKPANTGKIYNIGDTGPAGGIVFYDKGRAINGWRYLEAAPVEAEFTAQWSAYDMNVSGTESGVGMGKKNTEIILAYLKNNGEHNKAAQLCDELSLDDFDDWFLPSKDELDLMYKNLKQKGLGEFGNVWYWSSSQSNHYYYGAWIQNFGDGSQHYNFKHNPYSVRAVRAF